MTKDEESDAYEAWKDGASQADIAEAMGVSQATVSRICRKWQRAEEREKEREKQSPRILAREDDGDFQSLGVNTFAGTFRDGESIERRVFEGLRSQAEEEWREWLGAMRDRAEFERALNRVAAKPPDETPEPTTEPTPEPTPEGKLFVLAVSGKIVGLFRDADRAIAIGERLGGALGLECDVTETEFWEGE